MADRSQASKLAYLPVASYIQNTASRAATPGGGACAALAGSLGVSLFIMVCRVTAGKKKYQAVDAAMRERVDALIPLRDRLKTLIDADKEAFDAVMAAFDLPKESAAEGEARQAAIAEAYRGATAVPLEVMELCQQGLELGHFVAEEGSENAISDAGVAGHLLHGAFQGAALNVRINLPELPDGELKERALTQLAALTPKANAQAQAVAGAVAKRMPS